MPRHVTQFEYAILVTEDFTGEDLARAYLSVRNALPKASHHGARLQALEGDASGWMYPSEQELDKHAISRVERVPGVSISLLPPRDYRQFKRAA
jgi:hypothetical protein